jgi:type VI secretion system protein ImpJ
MKTPQRLVWSEGTFLSPQHLQSLDRYHEGLLAARVGAISSYPWGVAALEIDAAALAAGQLRLQRFEGVLADGLAVAFTESDAEAPPAREVGAHFPTSARTLDVHLAVPLERDGVTAYDEPAGEGVRSRFAIASRQVNDSTRPGAAAAVSFARPNTLLLLGAEPREDYETIKIAELIRTGSGQLAVSESYVPPLLRISGAPRLLASLRDLVTRLLAKQRDLAGGRRGAAEVTAPELTRMLQLLVVSGGYPTLAYLSEAGDASPLATYLALVQFAGQLAAVSPDTDVSNLPKFSHGDLRGTFDPLLARIQAFVGGLALERFTRLPLEVRAGLHVARVQDDRLLRGVPLFLSVKSDIPEAQVAEQLPRLCKVAALPDVQALVQAAAPGLPLQATLRPPPELPQRPGVVYFLVTPAERLWKNVQADRTLAIYLPPPFDPSRAKVELLALGVPPAGAPGSGA